MWLSIVLGFFFNYYFNNLWFILLFSGGLAAFRTFLKTEFSDENIEFWMACEEYKKVKSCTKMMSKANKIFKEFIDVQAPREVCVCYMTLLERWHLINKCNNLLWWFFFFFLFLYQSVHISIPTGQHWLPHQREDQAEPGGAIFKHSWWSPGSSLQPHGERLLPTIPQVQDVPGDSQQGACT